MTARRHAIALLTSLSLAGCGVTDPYASKPTTAPPNLADLRTPPATAPRAQVPVDARPERVAAAYATARGTYSAATYPTAHRRMSGLATGQLARQLSELTPSEVSATLHDTATRSTATVLSSLLERRSGTRATVIVAAAQTTHSGSENGLGAPDYLFARTLLFKTGAGWRVAAFEVLL